MSDAITVYLPDGLKEKLIHDKRLWSERQYYQFHQDGTLPSVSSVLIVAVLRGIAK